MLNQAFQEDLNFLPAASRVIPGKRRKKWLARQGGKYIQEPDIAKRTARAARRAETARQIEIDQLADRYQRPELYGLTDIEVDQLIKSSPHSLDEVKKRAAQFLKFKRG